MKFLQTHTQVLDYTEFERAFSLEWFKNLLQLISTSQTRVQKIRN